MLPDRLLAGSVAISGDRIEALIPAGMPLPESPQTIDLGGAFLAPGLVDIHIHGAAGVDVMTAGEDELRRLAGWLAFQGVTRFLPTLVATSLESYAEVVGRIAKWVGRMLIEPPVGAIPVGIHFEGPFLNANRCGALKKDRFLTGSDRAAFFESVGLERLEGLPARLITIAPEIEGGIELVADCTARGFVVSIGHTEADPALLDKALSAGARHMTHFMNAMPQMHQRHPGPVAWGLLRNRATVDVIADFEHLHRAVVRLVVGAKTSTRVALISDAIPPTGLGDGSFSVWDETITVRDGKTANANGSLAGSVITLRDAVRNVTEIGIPLVDSIRMASLVPARVLDLEAFGALSVGKIADCIAFDEGFEPFLTVVAGHVVYHVAA